MQNVATWKSKTWASEDNRSAYLRSEIPDSDHYVELTSDIDSESEKSTVSLNLSLAL